MTMKKDKLNLTPIQSLDDHFPTGLARPAQRALAGAGFSRLEQLAQVSEAEISELHGIGPNALKQLRLALQEKGLSFVNP